MSDVESEELEDQGPNLGSYEGDRNELEERHGFGKAVLPNGDTYEGYYSHGKRHGQGTYKYKSGARYVGDYQNNKKQGSGTFVYPDGSKYEGSWASDQRNGKGLYTYANSDSYDGDWCDNLRHGQGTYVFADTGAKFTGKWVNGRREGLGELHYDNYRYQGSFTNDQPQGPGKYVFDIGCQQLGEYVLDQEQLEGAADDDENAIKVTPRWRGAEVIAS
ncbi:radial spoke head 1 homolog [Dysidea avara]|uniref:radial spoke head 1 homolog n=1 Tax=Dysidea avara TaxID=196820 RepID=UPI0033233258